MCLAWRDATWLLHWSHYNGHLLYTKGLCVYTIICNNFKYIMLFRWLSPLIVLFPLFRMYIRFDLRSFICWDQGIIFYHHHHRHNLALYSEREDSPPPPPPHFPSSPHPPSSPCIKLKYTHLYIVLAKCMTDIYFSNIRRNEGH